MEAVRNSARRFTAEQSDSARKIEKANESASAASSLLSMLQTPAANGFFVSQKLALEGARFWARRMRAYADQLEMLARCTNANQVAEVHSQFFERMQDDYAKETAAVSDIVILPKVERGEGEQAEA